MDTADLQHRFEYHPPRTEERVEDHAIVRSECRRLAETVNSLGPDSREKSLAITAIEEAMFWANAMIARQLIAGPVEPATADTGTESALD